jgi:hypothetical protein
MHRFKGKESAISHEMERSLTGSGEPLNEWIVSYDRVVGYPEVTPFISLYAKLAGASGLDFETWDSPPPLFGSGQKFAKVNRLLLEADRTA